MKSDEALWQEVDQALRRELGIAILQAAHAWCADLPVLGTHGAGPQARWRYGSVAAAIAPFTDMPLLVVPGKSRCRRNAPRAMPASCGRHVSLAHTARLT